MSRFCSKDHVIYHEFGYKTANHPINSISKYWMENVNDMVEPFVLNPFWSSPPSPDFSGSELSSNDVEAPLAPLVEFGGLSPTTLANVGDSSITITSLKFQFDSFTLHPLIDIRQQCKILLELYSFSSSFLRKCSAQFFSPALPMHSEHASKNIWSGSLWDLY